jgi:alpha-ketoglutaric semialdehyde dehydrogenase
VATVNLTGQHWIAGDAVPAITSSFSATCAETGQPLEPSFGDATVPQIVMACEAAASAFKEYRQVSQEVRAELLEAIADEIMEVGDPLLERCQRETAFPRERLLFERKRTVNQARLFAQVVRDGSWAEPRLDHANSEQNSPDCRSQWLPVGPIAVFGASNFPLAISVVGNDTIAALAAGCSVVVKAHPGHPGTCEILAGCLNRAIKKRGLPSGLFSLLHGVSHDVGQNLVLDPRIQAVGFTGSLAGGRALFDAVSRRPQLIPVYAEMGSVNPVFFLPQVLQEDRWRQWIGPLVGSITAGCGQMCTQPGLILGTVTEAWQELRRSVDERVSDQNFTLLHPGIAAAYRRSISQRAFEIPAAEIVSQAIGEDNRLNCQVAGRVFNSRAAELLRNSDLEDEIFGPTTLFVDCESVDQMCEYARKMKGSLTASVFATPNELELARPLIDELQTKVGRIIFNGFPTGVQVNHAMMHGGPYPAAIGQFTSIGTGSIKRFARPVCFQNFPEALLPESLRDQSADAAFRLVDGKLVLGTATR